MKNFSDLELKTLRMAPIINWNLTAVKLSQLDVLKSNGPNSISKDALRDEGCP